jgi:hypothetical protein
MVGRTPEKRRVVAVRQECRDWPITTEPAAEEFRCQQEIGEGDCEGEGKALQTHATSVFEAIQSAILSV